MQHGMRAVGNVQKTGVKSHGTTNIGLDNLLFVSAVRGGRLS